MIANMQKNSFLRFEVENKIYGMALASSNFRR